MPGTSLVFAQTFNVATERGSLSGETMLSSTILGVEKKEERMSVFLFIIAGERRMISNRKRSSNEIGIEPLETLTFDNS